MDFGTPHNEAKKEDIAKVVIMPGDPLRAKWISETYLKDAKLVSNVRGICAYTGKYNGKTITVMAHGMGIPSIGIYSYELYKFYDVDTIIRVGTCGAYSPDLNLYDTVLETEAYSDSNYAYNQNGATYDTINSNEELNEKIKKTALKININLITGKIHSLYGLY